MFIAMNRFKVVKGEEATFETIWSSRKSRLDEMPGFIAFHLLKGPERQDHTLYSSHTSWASKADFEVWTKSEQFRESHRNAGKPRETPVYLGHPEFEGFETILSEVNPQRPLQAANKAPAMTQVETAAPVPEDGSVARIRAALAEKPDGVVEAMARELGVAPLAVLRQLPEEQRRFVAPERFKELWKTMSEWGTVLFIVHTADIVLECEGSLPVGSFGHGYYNIHGDSPIGGHIRAGNCRAIHLVDRPFHGRRSCSVQFFNEAGEAMFKVFVRRGPDRGLLPDQLARFEALKTAFA